MSQAIKEAIELLEAASQTQGDIFYYIIKAEQALTKLRSIKEPEPNRWIPVSERLPKSPTHYLCCDMKPGKSELPSIYTATTWSKAEGFYTDDGSGKMDVRVYPTHWKPIILPCPTCKAPEPKCTCGDTGEVPKPMPKTPHPCNDVNLRRAEETIPCPDCKVAEQPRCRGQRIIYLEAVEQNDGLADNYPKPYPCPGCPDCQPPFPEFTEECIKYINQSPCMSKTTCKGYAERLKKACAIIDQKQHLICQTLRPKKLQTRYMLWWKRMIDFTVMEVWLLMKK